MNFTSSSLPLTITAATNLPHLHAVRTFLAGMKHSGVQTCSESPFSTLLKVCCQNCQDFDVFPNYCNKTIIQKLLISKLFNKLSKIKIEKYLCLSLM